VRSWKCLRRVKAFSANWLVLTFITSPILVIRNSIPYFVFCIWRIRHKGFLAASSHFLPFAQFRLILLASSALLTKSGIACILRATPSIKSIKTISASILFQDRELVSVSRRYWLIPFSKSRQNHTPVNMSKGSVTTCFNTTRLNATTFVIREKDIYNDNPLIYVKIFSERPLLLLSDTGSGGYGLSPSIKLTYLRSYLETFPLYSSSDKPLNTPIPDNMHTLPQRPHSGDTGFYNTNV
jgi:hypothetical protein